MRKFKSILALVLALAMVLGCIGTSFAAQKTKIEDIAGTKQTQSTADKSAKKEIAAGFLSEEFKKSNTYQYADDEIVRAIVLLEGKCEAEVGEAGSEKAAAQRVKLINEHNAVRKAMTGISYDMQYEFTTLLNGFSCDVAYGDLEKIAAIEGVKAVHIANSYAAPKMDPKTDTKMEIANYMTGNIDSAYYEFDGAGIVVAVLDTGLNLTHEAFQDSYGVCAEYGVFTEEYIASVADTLNGEGVYVNGKIPFAYDYANKDNDVTDHDGHGTHVSGIVGGYVVEETDEGASMKFMGGSPYAQIVSMKVFKDAGGGTSSDIYYYALEDAYKLGVDVVNMSLGAQNGFTYDDSLETEVFGNIYETMANAGIIMSVAAGNEYSMAEYSTMGYIGPEYTDYGTVATPSTYYGNVSIASVENIAYPYVAITVDGVNMIYIDSATAEEDMWLTTFGDTSAEFVVVKDAEGNIAYGYESDYETNDVKDKIAVVSRGDITFEEKVEFAANAGAIGCIVVNNDTGRISMAIETFEIPAISLELFYLEVLMNAESDVIFSGREPVMVENAEGAMMSTFSNWGTSPMLTLDPTITSVGGYVYSTFIGADDAYQLNSGTSMAAPNASATYANVLTMLYSMDPEMDKVEAAETAKNLLASTAIILTDADDYAFSPRKQGAGLANSYYAIENYQTAGYIVDPLKELGDDADKTGVYEFSVTVKNTCGEDRYYSNFTADILTDWISNLNTEENPIIGNTLMADTCEADVTYSIDGVEVTEFTVAADSEVSVDICIKLTEDQKEFFDTYFENGAYVEGFITFYDMEDGEIFTDTHATFLAYYGDWGKACAMEALSTMELMEALYYLYNVPVDAEGNTYADYGYTPYDLLVAIYGNVYTDINGAYLYDTYYEEEVTYLGANVRDLYNTEYMPEHIAISTPMTDGTYYYADAFYLSPSLLRNVRHIVMTVSNAETGEVYYVDDTEYVPKSVYDYEEEYWVNYSMFMWDGTDADGNYVPSGTVAKVTFDAQLPWGEDANVWQEAIWTFDCTVDYTAPVLESVVYDEEAKTLTVTASDENYLAGIYLADSNYKILAQETLSSDKKGESFTATFDVSEIDAAYVTALDYATNEYEEWTAFGIEAEPATLTFNTADGKTTIDTTTGATYTFGSAEDPEGYRFVAWTTERVEMAESDEDLPEEIYRAGDSILVSETEYTFYALYAAYEATELDKLCYWLDYGNGFEGDWAICGWNINEAGTNYVIEDPVALDAEGNTVRVADIEDAEVSEEYVEFFTNDDSIRFTIEEIEEGLYTIKSAATGKYLATDAEFNMLFVDEVDEFAVWMLVDYEHFTNPVNAGNTNAVLVHDYYASGKIEIMDNSTPYMGSYYPTDVFATFFYRADSIYESLLYYTTEVAHNCPSEIFTDIDVNQWYHEAVDFAVENEIMNGMTATTFEPEGTLTRAQVATMLYRIFGEQDATGMEEPFADVNESDWFYAAVTWAYNAGIINGMSATTFEPNASITREQLAVMLYRTSIGMEIDVEALLGTDLTSYEDDAKVSDYASEAMAWACGAGLINGISYDNSGKLYLAPQGNATRAQAAKIFMMWIYYAG